MKYSKESLRKWARISLEWKRTHDMRYMEICMQLLFKTELSMPQIESGIRNLAK